MTYLTYNSTASTSSNFGIIGIQVNRPLLPGLNNYLAAIKGRDGVFDLGRNFGPSFIEVLINANSSF